MSDSDYVNASGSGAEIYAVLYVFAAAGSQLDGPDVHALFDGLARRVAPGMTMSGGPSTGVASLHAPVAILTFTLDHVPLPLEAVIEWLREQPVVRVLEVERRVYRDPPPGERLFCRVCHQL